MSNYPSKSISAISEFLFIENDIEQYDTKMREIQEFLVEIDRIQEAMEVQKTGDK